MAERATFINSEDCQGRPSQYWRATRFNSWGEVVFGTGATESEADRDADRRLQNQERFIALDPIAQLRILGDKPELSPKEIERAVRILIKQVCDAS